jgi:hypothetical protein
MSSFFGENSPAWTDMSDYVVHFTKNYEGKEAYDNMLGILSNRVIRARNPFGIARTKAPDLASQKAVCFSEVPLHLLGRLADKRSEYGIGFGKAFVIHRMGNPILYAYKDQPVTQAIQNLVASAGNDTTNPIWEMTPFVDAPGAYPNGSYFFEWEREWRKVGDFKFSVEDVAFLIIPEHQQEAARNFFADAKDENLGPAYDCPYIDAHWKQDKIAHALGMALTQT